MANNSVHSLQKEFIDKSLSLRHQQNELKQLISRKTQLINSIEALEKELNAMLDQYHRLSSMGQDRT